MGEIPLLTSPAVTAPARAAAEGDAPSMLPVLAVDLDGTLLRTDVTAESIFVLAKRDPLALLALPVALLHGRAALKRQLAERAQPDVDTLPLNEPLVDFLSEQKRRGRTLVLATGADHLIAKRIAARLGLFDSVIASDGHANMTGAVKRARLVAAFGARGFDYVGNSHRDRTVWAAARQAILAGSAAHHPDPVRAVASVGWILEEPGLAPLRRISTWLEQLRWRHWIKNGLVVLPLMLSHRLGEISSVAAALLATAGFCAVASSIYVMNDLIDLTSDRRHPRKRLRPLASGRLPVLQAVSAIPVLWFIALLAATPLPQGCGWVMALYVAGMLAYSVRLKDLRYLDAAVLAGGYTLRMLAGTWAIGMAVDPWLAAWCLPTFFGLALLKRCAELAASAAHPGSAHGRSYRLADVRPLTMVGRLSTAAGAAALALLPLAHGDSLAATAGLWLAALLSALWADRLWESAARGDIQDDPVAFALRDPASRGLGLAAALLLVVLA
ncbi:MAG TPA: UbiA family prenyltransferase [Burkholderiaceae bacterium]